MYCYPSTPLEAVVPQISSFLTAEYRMNIAVFQKRIERVMRLVMAGMMRAQTARRAENAPSAKRVKVEEVKRESEEEESVKEESVKEEDMKEEDMKEEDTEEEEMKEEDTEEETMKEEDTDSTEESTKEVPVKKEDAKNTPHTFDEAINAILNERDWRKPNGTR